MNRWISLVHEDILGKILKDLFDGLEVIWLYQLTIQAVTGEPKYPKHLIPVVCSFEDASREQQRLDCCAKRNVCALLPECANQGLKIVSVDSSFV